MACPRPTRNRSTPTCSRSSAAALKRRHDRELHQAKGGPPSYEWTWCSFNSRRVAGLARIIVLGIGEAGKGEHYDLKCIHSLSRRVALGGNPFGIPWSGRVPDSETERRLDRAFFNNHGFNERDGIPVSVP